MRPRHPQYAQTILGTALKIDGGGFLEVFGGAGHLGNVVPLVDDLGEHLVVEDEIIRIAIVVDALQDLATKGAVARMLFR